MISVRQLKAARALVAWSQGDLSAASGISEPTIARLESEDGPLGGRVETGERLVAALEKAGYTIDRRKVVLAEPIKALGDYKVTVKLHREVTVELPVHVIKEE